MVAILAAGITTIVQPQFVGTMTVTTEIPETTITQTITETLSKSTTTTQTATVTSTATLIRTTTVTTVVTTTVTQIPIEAPSINLVSTQEGKAASWSKTHLRILVRTDGAREIDPDLPVVDAVGSAVDQWRRSIAQFTEINPEYFYLDRLILTVYVQGENDTLLRGSSDIDIKFTDSLPSLIGETKLLVTNANSIGYAEITVGLQDLSLRGLHNVLTHELGHALGLKHSAIEEDLMYSEREKSEVKEGILCPSTLDLYALASIYQWIETGSYSPYNASSITLPEATEYMVVACNP